MLCWPRDTVTVTRGSEACCAGPVILLPLPEALRHALGVEPPPGGEAPSNVTWPYCSAHFLRSAHFSRLQPSLNLSE